MTKPMNAIVIDHHGGPEVLTIKQVPRPEPANGEVTLRVTHVGLNHLDVWVRRGVEGHTFPLPLIPGSDVVGVREDTGEAVAVMPATAPLTSPESLRGHHDLDRRFHIRGESMNGGCCEQIAVPEWQLLPLGGLQPEQAAALPLSLLTAWHMLVTRAQLRPGQRVLVQGGSGGVGHLAIQVARAAGARVAATASTPQKRALCESLGAEAVFSYDDAVSGVKNWTRKAGVDVVVEHVGAATWASSLRMVRWGGTVVTCGATTGHQVPLDLRVLFFKQISLVGSTMGSFGEMLDAWSLAQTGRIRPIVHTVGSMRRLGDAQALLAERKVVGKVVVVQDLS
jgi:NADPH:quinone reductase-like Zn-dependent oxidoreductase